MAFVGLKIMLLAVWVAEDLEKTTTQSLKHAEVHGSLSFY